MNNFIWKEIMNTQGIRISDGSNVLEPTLADILAEVSDGDSFYWSIFFITGVLEPNQELSIFDLEREINKSKNGKAIRFAELTDLSNKFFQMYETIVLGCKDSSLLRRYEKEEEMYCTCDIVIDLIDCVFWEVYSKDHNLLERLRKKFREVEMLEACYTGV